MPAYVHINIRVIDSVKQASLAPRFISTLRATGGRVLHFGPVAEVLEGEISPLPLAGVFEFPNLSEAMAFYNSAEYAPIKAEWAEAQEARMFIVATA